MKDYISAQERTTVSPLFESWKRQVAEESFLLVVCFTLLVAFVWQFIVDITN